MLPKLPMDTAKWAKKNKRQQEIVTFRGLNRTENTQDGEFSNTKNLSTAKFPCISQRAAVQPIYTSYVDSNNIGGTGASSDDDLEPVLATDIFAWDGRLFFVSGSILRCIDFHGFPVNITNLSSAEPKQFAVVNTKLCIWPDKKYVDLTNMQFGYLDASFETTAATNNIVITGSTFKAVLLNDVVAENQFFSTSMYNVEYAYTYGSSAEAVAACWDTQNAQWDMTALAALQNLEPVNDISAGALQEGSIFIPGLSNNAYFPVTGYSYWPRLPDTEQYNSLGYYAVIKTGRVWGEQTEAGLRRFTEYTFDVYNAVSTTPLFSGSFRVGDAVSFTDMPSGDNVSHAIIRGIDDDTNTLTFDAGTFSTTGTYSGVVTIKRDVPDLDYICEKDNRLWGVSNSQTNEVWDAEQERYVTFTSRAIYASALGDPTNWYVFDGLDSDSYQVAVGTEGDFTGICSYGGAVCCWKEDRLHKIMGGYPSEYYMNESHIEGVAAGSSRSITVVNEVMYYNGATGVYAYTGSTPVLIGYPLGVLYSNAVGGSNGLRWYLSGTKPDGTKELVVFDLTHKIWIREDALDVAGFATIGNNLYRLANGFIFLTEASGSMTDEWIAEFVAFDETALIRKYYLRILLRLEVGAGSQLEVWVKYDDGSWIKRMDETYTSGYKVKDIELPVKRCDKMQVRLVGHGSVLVRDMRREFIIGSERP